MVLHADEFGPAMQAAGIDRLRELPGAHVGSADVAGLAGFHHVMQRFHGFLDRHGRVGSVDLIEVDEVGSEAAQAVVDLAQDRLARQAGAVRSRPHPAIDLGCDHDVLAAHEILQRAADDFLRGAVRIDIGGIEKIDAEVERLLDQRPALLLVQRPWMRATIGNAIGHAADAQPRHAQAGLAEFHIVHGSTP